MGKKILSILAKMLMLFVALALILPGQNSLAAGKKQAATAKKEEKAKMKFDSGWQKENKIVLDLTKARKYDEAIAKGQSSLEYLKSKNMSESLEAATTLNNLGMNSMSAGKLDKANGYLQKALELRRKHLGPTNIEVGAVWMNLSELYKLQAQVIRQKELDTELKKEEAAFAELTKDKNTESKDAAAVNKKLGELYLVKGQFDKASKHLSKALELREKHYGAGSPEAAASWMALSELYRIQAQYIYQLNARAKQAAAK
jgi:tetratricopeptide (TPR) repeat protein